MSPVSGEFDIPQVFSLALIPAVGLKKGTLERPELRLIYCITVLNDDAMQQYTVDDPRYGRRVFHYLGFMAEWWFNSSYR